MKASIRFLAPSHQRKSETKTNKRENKTRKHKQTERILDFLSISFTRFGYVENERKENEEKEGEEEEEEKEVEGDLDGNFCPPLSRK